MTVRFERAVRGGVIAVGVALVLPSCFLDFDDYRERPAGTAGASAAGGSGGASGSGNGGSGNAAGTGGSSTGGLGGQGGSSGEGGVGGATGGVSGAGGTGGASGTGGSAGSSGASGSGGSAQCLPHDPGAVCAAALNCVFKSIQNPYDYSTSCVATGTGVDVGGCSNGDTTQCAPGYVCLGGSNCRRWCRLGFNDCSHCAATCDDSAPVPSPTIGGTAYGTCPLLGGC
jgi:hypothetical protein